MIHRKSRPTGASPVAASSTTGGYTILNENGQPVTKPIKASSFHNKPTLDQIESKGKENGLNREAEKRHLKTAVA